MDDWKVWGPAAAGKAPPAVILEERQRHRDAETWEKVKETAAAKEQAAAKAAAAKAPADTSSVDQPDAPAETGNVGFGTEPTVYKVPPAARTPPPPPAKPGGLHMDVYIQVRKRVVFHGSP